jgi:hypothetical protein
MNEIQSWWHLENVRVQNGVLRTECLSPMHVLESYPQCDGIWRWAFGWQLCTDEVMSEEPHSGINKGTRDSSLCHMRTQGEGGHLQVRRRVLGRKLTMLVPQELGETNVCGWSHPVCDILLEQHKKPNTWDNCEDKKCVLHQDSVVEFPLNGERKDRVLWGGGGDLGI